MRVLVYIFIALIAMTSKLSAQDVNWEMIQNLPVFKAEENPWKDDPEVEYFERFGEKGWMAGSTKGGERIGTWMFYKDRYNYKHVTYRNGRPVRYQRVIEGRRIFELSYSKDEIGGVPGILYSATINVYELTLQKDRTLDFKLVDELWCYIGAIQMGSHFINKDGTYRKDRANFGEKWKHGDEFKETLMGVPLK